MPEYQEVVKLAASRYKQVLASFPLPSCNEFPLGPGLLFHEVNHCEILLKTVGAEGIERNKKSGGGERQTCIYVSFNSF